MVLIPKENTVEEGIVKAKSHALEFPLQFRKEVLRVAALVEIPQDVFLRISKTILGATTIGTLLIAKPAVLVILSAFLGITQDAVGFVDALEAFLRRGASLGFLSG